MYITSRDNEAEHPLTNKRQNNGKVYNEVFLQGLLSVQNLFLNF